MTATLHILAERGEDPFELVMIALIVVVGIVVSIIKKMGARRAEEAQRERSKQEPRQPARPVRRVAQTDQTGRQPQRGRPQPVRTTGPAGPPPPPPLTGPDAELAQQALRAMGLIPLRQQPSEAEETVVLTPAEPESVRVGDELEHERRRQRDQEAHRRKRLAPRKVSEADLGAIEGGLLQVRPGRQAEQGLPTGPAVDLSSAERARRAIIFHEIFSAPRALRQGKEMWDV